MANEFKNEIRKITEQIIEKYKPEKIILFGSAARDQMMPDSDADFLIIYRPEEFEGRLAMGDPFLTAILSEGKVVYG